MSKSLDLGCGRAPKNPFNADEVFGVDYGMRPDLPANIRLADLVIEPIPFESDSFDFVTAHDFIEHVPRVLYNPTMASLNTMIPGLVAVILMISLMVVMSQAVVRERESGTLEQMFVTPITPTEYLIGKVTPYALLATAQMLVVAAVGNDGVGTAMT